VNAAGLTLAKIRGRKRAEFVAAAATAHKRRCHVRPGRSASPRRTGSASTSRSREERALFKTIGITAGPSSSTPERGTRALLRASRRECQAMTPTETRLHGSTLGPGRDSDLAAVSVQWAQAKRKAISTRPGLRAKSALRRNLAQNSIRCIA
jgi:hypothetical protein